MGVLHIREEGRGRVGAGRRTERRYKRVFTVEMQSPTDGPEQVLTGVDPTTGLTIPQRGDFYNPASGLGDVTLFCETVDLNLIDKSRLVWMVVAFYTNQIDPQAIIEDPTQRPAKVVFDTVTIQVPVIEDQLDHTAILNSAGDPFDPVPEEEESRTIIKITVNRLDYDPVFYRDFHNTLNNAPFIIPYRSGSGTLGMTFKRRELKLKKVLCGEREVINGNYFWPTTFWFETRPERIPGYNVGGGGNCVSYLLVDGGPAKGGSLTSPIPSDLISYCWTRFILDRGTRIVKKGFFGNTVLIRARDPQTLQPFTKPPLLDGSGNLLAFNGLPVFIGYDLLPEMDFTTLGNLNP